MQICAVNVANGVRQTGETAGLDLDALVAPPLKCFNANSLLKLRENQKFGALVLKVDSPGISFWWFTGCLRYLVKGEGSTCLEKITH